MNHNIQFSENIMFDNVQTNFDKQLSSLLFFFIYYFFPENFNTKFFLLDIPHRQTDEKFRKAMNFKK